MDRPRQSLLKSWYVAFAGLFTAIKTERNVRIVAVCMVAAVVLAAAFRISAIEWIIVVLCCGLVMVTELLNTAIESVTDLACEERHPLAAASKDTAAAATLMASGTALIAGLIIFAPKIINLICCWL